MNKIKFIFFILLFVIVSLKYGSNVRGFFLKYTNSTLVAYLELKETTKESISEHFDQIEKIRELEAINENLDSSIKTLSAFASKLNDILKAEDIEKYEPKVKLVSSIAYVNLNDYYKVWINYKDFNSSRIYGLLNKGNCAGIVIEKNGNPMALLLGDPKSIFSVFIGSNKIPGIAMGKKNEVHVKYIPSWLNPKKGDKVVTSGLDDIFFRGVGVGVVTKVIKEELSKTAIIEPYSKINIPSYYHIIEKN
ncbi:MAG: rod shape-determining protein MreC [Sulfurospirillum sp.]|nr:rod shape-determining protein MreC [Sulfurospirillum sp.]MBL0702461.1 rod shape-determining protein MreC [Sulfurospirillum sp.]